MERRLEQASEAGVRVLILRAGDFFGPSTGNSWFAQSLVKPGRPVKHVTDPGRKGAGHAWAYLPDFAETMARLADQEGRLGAFERFHFGGHWFEDGRAMADAVRRVAGVPQAPIRAFPWALVCGLSPAVPPFRELVEMKYLWDTPLRLDNTRLTTFLGGEPHTQLDAALRTTLQGMNCLTPSLAEETQGMELRCN